MSGTRGAAGGPSPVPKPPRLVVVAGLVWVAPARLVVQRRARTSAHGAGLLELPGGKIERGESPAVALRRELFEEWGEVAGELSVGAVVDVAHHVYPSPGPEVLLVVLHVDGSAWDGQRWRDRIVLPEGVEVEEREATALRCDDFLAADRDLIDRVRRGELTNPAARSHTARPGKRATST